MPRSGAALTSRQRCSPVSRLTIRVSVINVHEAKEAELRQRFLAQAATLSSSLDYEETLQRVGRSWCPACKLVRGGRVRRQPAPQARRRGRTSTPARSPSRADCAIATSPIPTRTGDLRRAALRASRALPRAARRAARAEHRGPGAARDDPRAGHALGHAHPDGRRRAHDRRADDGRRPRAGAPSRRTTWSSRARHAGPRPRSRTRACTPSARQPRKRCRRACSPRSCDHAGLGAGLVVRRCDTTSTSAATSSTSSSSTRASSPSSATSPARLSAAALALARTALCDGGALRAGRRRPAERRPRPPARDLAADRPLARTWCRRTRARLCAFDQCGPSASGPVAARAGPTNENSAACWA